MLVTQVRACIETYSMLAPGAKVVVAVSGGADSTALLSLLFRLQALYDLTLIVAYVNHQLRGEEAEREALFVEQQAARLNLAFYQTRLDVASLQYASGLSIQQAARQLRYRYFEQLCSSLSATHVALGHTADDQAETLLLRLVCGSGPAGLAGIPFVRPPFIRPLITVSRHAILAYLRAQCIPWIEDSSNAHTVYLRNRVRQHLMPVLQQLNPRIVRRLNELADMLGAENRALEQHTDVWDATTCTRRADKIVDVHCASFRRAPLAVQRRLLRRILDQLLMRDVRISFRHIEGLRQYILAEHPRRRLGLPGGLCADYRVNTVRLWNVDALPSPTRSYILPFPGQVEIVELNMRLLADIREKPLVVRTHADTAFLALDHLAPPLRVRFRQPGDRFYPLGSRGSKKLHDFYIDSRIPYGERPYIPLVVSGQDIVWVVGHRIAEPFRMRPETRRVVRLQCCTINE